MIWLHLTAGRGPIECHYFLSLIHPVLQLDAENQGLSINLLDYEQSPHGCSSVLIAVEGEKESDFAKSWTGSIQWIWKSTIRLETKRKRWFIGVKALILNAESSLEILESDLKWETMKASGPGGQHVNSTNSAVRLLYIPLGLSITAREERSQFRNKALALAKLHDQLKNLKEDKLSASNQERWQDHNNVVRGSAIRTYEGIDFKLKL